LDADEEKAILRSFLPELNETLLVFRREKPEHQRRGHEGPRAGQSRASR
jgi:hypothetical protein